VTRQVEEADLVRDLAQFVPESLGVGGIGVESGHVEYRERLSHALILARRRRPVRIVTSQSAGAVPKSTETRNVSSPVHLN
jgi:hypothetical protein